MCVCVYVCSAAWKRVPVCVYCVLLCLVIILAVHLGNYIICVSHYGCKMASHSYFQQCHTYFAKSLCTVDGTDLTIKISVLSPKGGANL